MARKIPVDTVVLSKINQWIIIEYIIREVVIERGRGWLGSRLARVMVEDRTVSKRTITQKKISKGFKKKE